MNMHQEIMGSHASPDLWVSAERNPDVEFRQFFSENILRKTIESAEVHYTKAGDELRQTIGLNTKFRRYFFSAEVRYTICVVEFRWKTKKKSAFFCNRFGATGSQFSADIFF